MHPQATKIFLLFVRGRFNFDNELPEIVEIG
jgi:hypothetical protein